MLVVSSLSSVLTTKGPQNWWGPDLGLPILLMAVPHSSIQIMIYHIYAYLLDSVTGLDPIRLSLLCPLLPIGQLMGTIWGVD